MTLDTEQMKTKFLDVIVPHIKEPRQLLCIKTFMDILVKDFNTMMVGLLNDVITHQKCLDIIPSCGHEECMEIFCEHIITTAEKFKHLTRSMKDNKKGCV